MTEIADPHRIRRSGSAPVPAPGPRLSYRDWMMDFYRNRIMNHKNRGPVDDSRLLAARRKRLALALKQGRAKKK